MNSAWLWAGMILGTLLGAGCEYARADELWISPGAVSQHNRGGYQQTNKGIGLEYRTGDYGVIAGEYDNSIHRTTHYALGMYQPWSIGPVRVGFAAGVVDGYRIRAGKPFPAIVPMMSYNYGRVGVNVTAIPPIEKGTWVIAAQFKLQIF